MSLEEIIARSLGEHRPWVDHNGTIATCHGSTWFGEGSVFAHQTREVLAAVRSALAADPGLATELGMEQVGFVGEDYELVDVGQLTVMDITAPVWQVANPWWRPVFALVGTKEPE